MKIVQLTAENVKRLLAVHITPGPDGSMIVVGGDNGQGKTSLLDSIAMAIGGGESIPEQPIRQGASKAKIILETEDLIVTRTFSAKGTQLVVTNKEGVPCTSPQKLLDELTNRTSFDPLAFTRMDSDEQSETLRRLVGIDFSALDAEYAAKYAERTGVNREIKTQQARIDQMQRYPDAKEKHDAEVILLRLDEANEVNQRNQAERAAVTRANEIIETRNEQLRDKQKAFEQAEEDLEHARAMHSDAILSRDALHKSAEALVDVDTFRIMEQLKAVEETNKKVDANAQWQKEQERLVAQTKKTNALTDRLAEIEKEKEETLAKKKFPVAGLAFTTDGVTFNGVPFAQASAAEQLRVSVAMGFALQPKLKVALIRDGSLLDDKNLIMVAKLAEEAGGQLWLETVSKGEQCTVIIEDGQVKEDRTPAGKSRTATAKKASKD